MEQRDLVISPQTAASIGTRLPWRKLRRFRLGLRSIQYLYVFISLPTVLLICFLVPPMQAIDESGPFVRASQIAQGGVLAEIDPSTGRGGGELPAPVADFGHQWKSGSCLQSNAILRTI